MSHGGYSRREFLQVTGTGALAMVATPPPGVWEDLTRPDDSLDRPCPEIGDYPRTVPRTYADAHLAAVAMPIGGIGTGSIWLDGQGRLAVWQIFNNQNEERLPDSFLALRVQVGDEPPVLRLLQTVDEPGFEPMAELTYEGGYPIARLRFSDPDLPLDVLLEAFNPLIPLDSDNSSLPCAVFRITVRNTGRQSLRVAVVGTLQNACGQMGTAPIQHVRSERYGGQRNRVTRRKQWAGVLMDARTTPPPSGMCALVTSGSADASRTPLLWLEEWRSLSQPSPHGASEQWLDHVVRLSRDGGMIIAAGVGPTFFHELRDVRQGLSGQQGSVTFADFEAETYGGWKAEGSAFGSGPVRGTLPHQHAVSGYYGERLVNSFQPNDGTIGRLISPAFTIAHRYIGFLVGGGSHAGRTCINLKIEGMVLRTATGRDSEALRPVIWDVGDLVGRPAVIEILDAEAGNWGHVLVDHIVFADESPETLLSAGVPRAAIASQLPLAVQSARTVQLIPRGTAQFAGQALATPLSPWSIHRHTLLEGYNDGDGGTSVLARTPDGLPLVLSAPLGQAALVLCLAADPPWDWVRALAGAARGRPLSADEEIVPLSRGSGTMALAAFDDHASATPHWTDGNYLAAQLHQAPRLVGPDESGYSPSGQTYNAAVSVPFRLRAGRTRTVTLAYTWHFPEVERHGHYGNYYATRFADAGAVADYLADHLAALWARTRLYHGTLYQSNLPEVFLDAISSQVTVLRSQTCWRAASGYFAGYEGCYGCCPLNCTHVWNYAQTHARLFPEIDRNMRVSDLLVYLKETGETRHRQHAECNAFIDGHCATICAAYRAYQTSPDRRFFDRIWPAVRKATDWLISAIDADEDGVPQGRQWNTYDCDVSGANTFIGSQYLAALEAAAHMASLAGEAQTAERYRRIRQAGSVNQPARLWNGEYYIQIPDESGPAHDYNSGCHSDQMLGQWWSHMLDMGHLYPVDQIRTALDAIVRHNLLRTLGDHKQSPRIYLEPDDGGLLMCTWPRGGRPDPFIIYADEVWTGIEYAMAGQLIYEGKIDEAREIVQIARARYDGRRRDTINSGPGGNPFNEVECGKFYARAMSSWGLLLASQGLVLDGPQGLIGFRPRWQPEDHRSLFVAAEGWGLFVQRCQPQRQTCRLEVRHGLLRLREVLLEVAEGAQATAGRVRAGRHRIRVELHQQDRDVRLRLAREVQIAEGHALEVELVLA